MDRKRLTTETFIESTKSVHGDRFDYSKVDYKGSHKKIIIICPEHGEFEQTPKGHLMGRGCRKCSAVIRANKQISTTEYFIEKAKTVHGDRYDYSKVEYTRSSEKVTIICKEHGEFEQTPSNHLNDRGCSECIRKIQLTTEEFITKAIFIHGDKYNYSKVDYKRNKEKVTIICKEHGEFKQRPTNHLGDQGCPKCSNLVSKPEIEVQDYVRSLGVGFVENDRTTILNEKTGRYLEIDLWFPDLNKAIEFNGTYWHGSDEVIKKDAYKKEYCDWKGIDLLIIEEHDWSNGKEGVMMDVTDFLNR